MKRVFTFLMVSLLTNAITSAQVTVIPEFLINTYTTSDQHQPTIAYDQQGNFIVTWASVGQDDTLSGTDSGIYAQRYDATGLPVGAEFLVNTTINSIQHRPDIAIAANGSFVITWASYFQDGDDYGIYFQQFDAAGVKMGNEEAVNITTAFPQDHPSIAMNANGDFAIAWLTFDQTLWSWNTFMRLFDNNGVAQTAEIVAHQETNNDQRDIDIAMDSTGNIVAVWASDFQDGSGKGVFTRLFDTTGTPITNDIQVNQGVLNDQYLPAVAMTANGQFAVTWISQDQDGDGKGIYVRQFDATGSPMGIETNVNTDYTGGDQVDPDIAVDTAGNFTVAWKSWGQDFDNYAVIAKRFYANGTPVGPEFIVNTYTISSQGEPAVAMTQNGNFTVVWESIGQDGSEKGIYAKCYSFDPPISTSVNENNFLFTARLYPNPANETTTLQLDPYSSGIFTIRIISTTGQIIHQQTIEKNTGTQLLPLQLQGLSKGMYQVQIINKAQVTTLRMLKQ
jgi:hypothetical protein